jgi:hypothetical protein
MRDKRKQNDWLAGATQIFSEFLGIEPDVVLVTQPIPGVDLALQALGKLFVVTYRASSSIIPLKTAIEQLHKLSLPIDVQTVAVVCVPFMGATGRTVCEEAGIGWFDMSGNGRIIGPGFHFRVDGRPNQFKVRGRPADIFAPKSSRIARWLLIHQGKSFPQRELARATGMDEGFVSRIVSRMVKEGLVRRDESGNVLAQDPAALMAAWREMYRIQAHAWLRGHIAARTGEEALQRLAASCQIRGIAYAATGLGAAWLYTHFAAFRIASIYLNGSTSPSWLAEIGFQEEPRGGNVWLIEPKDEGVFQGAKEVAGIRCVHPVQIYLDLKDHPERSAEAAEKLRKDFLNWRTGDC